MSAIKNCKSFFFRGVSVMGVLLIFLGGVGLFLTEKYQSNIKYLIFCLIGFVLIASISYFEFVAMNQREVESSRLLRKGGK